MARTRAASVTGSSHSSVMTWSLVPVKSFRRALQPPQAMIRLAVRRLAVGGRNVFDDEVGTVVNELTIWHGDVADGAGGLLLVVEAGAQGSKGGSHDALDLGQVCARREAEPAGSSAEPPTANRQPAPSLLQRPRHAHGLALHRRAELGLHLVQPAVEQLIQDALHDRAVIARAGGVEVVEELVEVERALRSRRSCRTDTAACSGERCRTTRSVKS